MTDTNGGAPDAATLGLRGLVDFHAAYGFKDPNAKDKKDNPIDPWVAGTAHADPKLVAEMQAALDTCNATFKDYPDSITTATGDKHGAPVAGMVDPVPLRTQFATFMTALAAPDAQEVRIREPRGGWFVVSPATVSLATRVGTPAAAIEAAAKGVVALAVAFEAPDAAPTSSRATAEQALPGLFAWAQSGIADFNTWFGTLVEPLGQGDTAIAKLDPGGLGSIVSELQERVDCLRGEFDQWRNATYNYWGMSAYKVTHQVYFNRLINKGQGTWWDTTWTKSAAEGEYTDYSKNDARWNEMPEFQVQSLMHGINNTAFIEQIRKNKYVGAIYYLMNWNLYYLDAHKIILAQLVPFQAAYHSLATSSTAATAALTAAAALWTDAAPDGFAARIAAAKTAADTLALDLPADAGGLVDAMHARRLKDIAADATTMAAALRSIGTLQ